MPGRAGRGLGRCGQMTVELAVVVPAAIVVALIVLNLMWFVDACAAFDQAALDAVVAHGVSPAGEQTGSAAVAQVTAALEQAMGREGACEVEVSAQAVSGGGGRRRPLPSPPCSRAIPARSSTGRGRGC